MLKLEGVHAYYGTSHILHGIDLSIEQGETVTLLGRNGAGKTTTMRTIMGLLRPKEGQVIFRGEVISGHKPFQIARKGIAYVPEERAIFVHLSLVENLKIAPSTFFNCPKISGSPITMDFNPQATRMQ